MDGGGLHARGLWRQWDCSWSEVEGMEEVTEVGRGNTIRRVRITRSNGRPFKLPVPFDARGFGRDPDFEGKLAQLSHQWRSGRKASTDSS